MGRAISYRNSYRKKEILIEKYMNLNYHYMGRPAENVLLLTLILVDTYCVGWVYTMCRSDDHHNLIESHFHSLAR